MKSILGELAGGVAIIVVASLAGVAQNTVRHNPVKLIQTQAPVSTAQKHHDTAAAITDTASTGASSGAETQGAEHPLPEGAVSLAELKAMFDEGSAFILDARAPSAFEEGHIPGSINIPYDKLPDYLDVLGDEVPMDMPVVCYCWGPSCDFSDQLATELKFMGYTEVSVFTGGWEEWTAAKYPTEGTAVGE